MGKDGPLSLLSQVCRRSLAVGTLEGVSGARPYCTDDGVGLRYRGTELVEAVSDVPGKSAYIVRRSGDEAVEERLEPRLLPG